MSEEHSSYGVLNSICEAIKSGMSREEALKRLNHALGNKGCRRDEQRFNCYACLDTGKVDVWSDDLIAELVLNGVDPSKARYRDMTCACFCKAGEPFLKRARPLVRVDPDKHCIVEPRGGASGATCNPKAVENLLTWITVQQSKPKPVEDPLFHQGGR